jgi:squalene synthase HpnC
MAPDSSTRERRRANRAWRSPAHVGPIQEAMTESGATRSGKTHKTENFPVASRLVRPEHRPLIMAFYDFARAADDIADAPDLASDEKLRRLNHMEAVLTGKGVGDTKAQTLRAALKTRGLTARHPRDLLIAFRADATKRVYADWWELMNYCAYSANPVGRFVLDVHGEDDALWLASDAICSALQIINHLQDCADDYAKIARVYIPQDRLAAHGAATRMLALPASPPGLRATIVELAQRTRALLREGRGLAGDVRDRRLRLEIEVIYALAEAHLDRLMVMDPLSQRTKLPRWKMGFVALSAAARGMLGAASRARISEAQS